MSAVAAAATVTAVIARYMVFPLAAKLHGDFILVALSAWLSVKPCVLALQVQPARDREFASIFCKHDAANQQRCVVLQLAA